MTIFPPKKSVISPAQDEHDFRSTTIAKPRIIAAILSEISAAEAVIIASTDGYTIQLRIDCRVANPFEDTRVRFKGPLDAMFLDQIKENTSLNCVALFAGQRLTFNLHCANLEPSFGLPKEIVVFEMRRLRRKRLNPEILSAEISSTRGVTFGTPLDISNQTIALNSTTPATFLELNETVKVRIRSGSELPDILFSEMTVQSLTVSDHQTRILLANTQDRQPVGPTDRKRRNIRRLRAFERVLVSPADKSLGNPVEISVTNASLTGFGGSFVSLKRPPWLVPGILVHLSSHSIDAIVIWISKENIGLKILKLDNKDELSRWFRLLLHWRSENGFWNANPEELGNLLAQAGFLKNERREIYGKSIGKFLPPQRALSNPQLFIRFQGRNDTDEIFAHASLVRLTDSAWILQEGVHTGTSCQMRFTDLLGNLTRQARELIFASVNSPRYLIWFWDSKITPTDRVASKICANLANKKTQVVHVPMNTIKVPQEKPLRFCDLWLESAESRRKILSFFDPISVEVFCGRDGRHPYLAEALSDLGPGHTVKTWVVCDDSNPLAMAFRMSSYYAMNATGVLNSTFLIFRQDISYADLHRAIYATTEHPVSFGTNDLAVVLPTGFEPNQVILNQYQAKEFNLLFIDLLLGLDQNLEG